MYYLVIIFGIATMHVFHFVVIISTLNFYVKSDFTIFWHFLTKKKIHGNLRNCHHVFLLWLLAPSKKHSYLLHDLCVTWNRLKFVPLEEFFVS